MMRKALCAVLLGVGLFALPGTASAVAVIEMNLYDGDWDTRATSWKFNTTIDEPSSVTACMTDGTQWYPSGHTTPISIGPPFKGSASRTRYVMICKNNNYLLVKLTIDLTSCTMWVCDTKYGYTEVRRHNTTSDHELYGGLSGEIDILLNPD